jgi:antitoxin CptB
MEREKVIKRLIYQSDHRGCKETDMYLGEFAKRYLKGFSDEQICHFEAILNEEDWDIYAWITGKTPLPVPHQNTVGELLMQFDLSEIIHSKK